MLKEINYVYIIMVDSTKHYYKYKTTIDEGKKRWAKTERGKKLSRARSLRYYYKKKDVFHPIYNREGSIERKFKKNNNNNNNEFYN